MCSQLNKLLPMQSYEIMLPASMSPTGMTTRKRPLVRPMLRGKTAIVKRSGPSSFGIHDFYQNIIEDHGVAGQLDISMLAVKQMSVLSTQAPHRFNQNVPLTSTPSVSPMTKTKDGVFNDCGFLIMGFNETRKSTLKTAIEEVGGHVEMAPSSWLQWTPPQPDRRWYILVPFVSDPSQIPTGTFKIITEYWIERCLTDEKLCPTQACIMYQPCSIKLPLPTLRDFVISTTGIEDALLSDQIKRLIGDIGARYDGCFTSRHPLLICGKPSGKKYEHALKWKTP
ncbi:hypothetical protein BDF22DRAFT_147852 [Syncephalis plumigaleata]|nr:hypothetical protein BDF22DRAFT_147852 [Syncephalis plumigaleata]